MKVSQGAARIAALLWGALLCFAVSAQDTQPNLTPAQQAMQTAWQAASQVLQRGPQTIALRDEAELKLPEGYGYVPVKEATALMESMGNTVDDRFLGLVLPLTNAEWIVSMQYEPSGYIKDDDAKNWKSDELLEDLKKGTEAGNARREEMGIPAFEVTRWVQAPSYAADTHRLVWSAESRDKGAPADADAGINYNTYLLGREGYVSMNLITSASQVEADKPAANELLAALDFKPGRRYTDFNSSTDKVAAYGLAALVGGIAAKKLGLLAMAGLFFAKFAKIIFLAVAGFGAAFARFFKRKT